MKSTTPTSADLSACPFCGSSTAPRLGDNTELGHLADTDAFGYTVYCHAGEKESGCGAQCGYWPSEDEAITAWNRRAAMQTAEPSECQIMRTGFGQGVRRAAEIVEQAGSGLSHAAIAGLIRDLQSTAKPELVKPNGYAYRYPDGYIRFSNGEEINGSKPTESLPYYFAAPDRAPSIPTVIIREPTDEERHEEGVAKLMASADRFNGDRAPSTDSTVPAITRTSTDSAAGWISVEDRLPSTDLLSDGSAPFVLVKWKRDSRADNLPDIDVSNTVYLAYNVDTATHWRPLPPPPAIAALQPEGPA